MKRKEKSREKNKGSVLIEGMVPVLCFALTVSVGAQEAGVASDQTEAYEKYVLEHVIPEFGCASVEPSSQYVQADMLNAQGSNDGRFGVLGTDTADFDGDGKEELVIYYFGSGTNTDGSKQLEADGALYADLYTENEDGEIMFVDTRKLGSPEKYDFSSIHAGLMTVENKPYLYLEWISEGYTTQNGDSGYAWLSYEDGAFVPVWQLAQTGDLENGLMYSLLTRKPDGSYDEAVLWADHAYREQHTDAFVYTVEGSTLDEAVKLGFQILGLPEAGTGESGYLYEAMPSYQQEECLKMSFDYVEVGTEGETENSLLMMVTVEDHTGFHEWAESAETVMEAEEETEEVATENAEGETEGAVTESVKEETEEAVTESAEEETEEAVTESVVEEKTEEAVTESAEGETEEAVTEAAEKETEEAATESVEEETEEVVTESVEKETAETATEAAAEEPETESLTTVHIQMPARQYFASSQGYGGEVEVSVLLGEKDEILDVSVIKCDDETADIGPSAAKHVSEEIVARQSAEVDTVSGATVTSEAVIRCVEAVLMTVQKESEAVQPESQGSAGEAVQPGSQGGAGEAAQSESQRTESETVQPESQEGEKYSSLTTGTAEFPIVSEESFWPSASGTQTAAQQAQPSSGQAQSAQQAQPSSGQAQTAQQAQTEFPITTQDSFTLPSGSAVVGDSSFYTDGTVVAQNQYILPESGSRYLTGDDLARMTQKGVSYAKNEIYAKHGRKFVAQELQEYFGRQSWYNGTIEPANFTETQVNTLFNEYEKANIRFISEWEASHGEYQY